MITRDREGRLRAADGREVKDPRWHDFQRTTKINWPEPIDKLLGLTEEEWTAISEGVPNMIALVREHAARIAAG